MKRQYVLDRLEEIEYQILIGSYVEAIESLDSLKREIIEETKEYTSSSKVQRTTFTNNRGKPKLPSPSQS